MEFLRKIKPRTSKLIMWVFIMLFIYIVYTGVNYDFSNITYMDTAIFCACITAVSGILGAIITKYYNNSNAENIPKIQTKLYKDTMDIRYEYNAKMIELKNKYNITSEDICDVENDSPMDDISENIVNTAVNELDSKADGSHEDVEIQNY